MGKVIQFSNDELEFRRPEYREIVEELRAANYRPRDTKECIKRLKKEYMRKVVKQARMVILKERDRLLALTLRSQIECENEYSWENQKYLDHAHWNEFANYHHRLAEALAKGCSADPCVALQVIYEVVDGC